jgi:hypothetical protein
MALENWKKEKEIIFHSTFWPNSAEPSKASRLLSPWHGPSPLPLLTALGRTACSRAAALPSTAFRLGQAQQAAWPASKRARLPLRH